jgi:hypothetical protein
MSKRKHDGQLEEKEEQILPPSADDRLTRMM